MTRILVRPILRLLWRVPLLRFLFLAATYGTVLVVCLWLAYQLRFDFNVPPLRTTRLLSIGAMTVLTHLFALFCFHQFDGLLTYFSTPDVKRLAAACTAGPSPSP